jgi:hypothetical protein
MSYILKEGGNVFKSLDGEELTQRIATKDVDTTVEFLERITGYDWRSELDEEDGRPLHYLGTTGRKHDLDGTFEKNSSGDLDLNTDLNKVSKADLIKKLYDWCLDNGIDEEDILNAGNKKKNGWIKDAGDQVHFRTPINGDPNNGYVQADFMFTDNPEFQIGAKRGGTEKYRGSERAIFLSSIARGRGYKFSPKFGLVDPDTNDVIANKWDEIAKILLGDKAKAEDTRTIERMLDILIKDPMYDTLVKGARSAGIDLPIHAPLKEQNKFKALFKTVLYEELNVIKSARLLTEGARIQHAEDVVFWEGKRGVLRIIDALISLEQGKHEDVTVKWDGSPAIIFGRNDRGQFVFTDKSGFLKKDGVGRATSPEDLRDELLNRSGGKFREDPDRVHFANRMSRIFSIYEKAVPKDFRGYFKGDLLYYDTPRIVDGQYVFKPQLVTYKVNKKSPIGKRIGSSVTGVVIHRVVDEGGQEGPLENADIFRGKEVFVVPPITAQKPPKVNVDGIKKLRSVVYSQGDALDSFLDASTLAQYKITDLPNIFYAYVNSKVDTGLNNLGKDFVNWLLASKTSLPKTERIKSYIAENQEGFNALWDIVVTTMQVKDDIISQLDNDSLDIEQSIGDERGGEGYVLSHPGGDIKLVPREFFSRANRAARR